MLQNECRFKLLFHRQHNSFEKHRKLSNYMPSEINIGEIKKL